MIGLEVFGTENAIPLVVGTYPCVSYEWRKFYRTPAQQRAVLKLDGEKEAVSERGATERAEK